MNLGLNSMVSVFGIGLSSNIRARSFVRFKNPHTDSNSRMKSKNKS